MKTAIESLAFIITTVAFIYGLTKVCLHKTNEYFRIIVVAVGCYVLEELWVIVNTICNINNGLITVRLIGIFGCFCAFLTANSNISKDELYNKANETVLAKYVALLAPTVFIILFIIYFIQSINIRPFYHIFISFIVILPLIIDSYFDLKYLLMPTNNNSIIKRIKPINLLILFEYISSLLYFFFTKKSMLLSLDITSGIIMAFIVMLCVRRAKKWEI